MLNFAAKVWKFFEILIICIIFCLFSCISHNLIVLLPAESNNSDMDIKKIINPWLNRPEYNCFGCCPNNPIGLHMTFCEEGEYITSKWHPNQNYQGWINTMHGAY